MNSEVMNLSLTEVIDTEVEAKKIFVALAKGKVFELTGADQISFDFKENGTFLLRFKDRGAISGEFIQIKEPDSIDMSWNVTGFGRPDEFSKVIFTIEQSGKNRARFEVTHQRIFSQQSLEAKQRAWREVLIGFAKDLQ